MSESGPGWSWDSLRAAWRFGGFGRLPVPRQQGVQLVVLGGPGDDALEYVGQPGQWIDIVQLGGLCRPPDYAERFRSDSMVVEVLSANAYAVAPFHSA